ncbi:MAG TPA: heterodisulfide reductase-related iron-sulfur binding cluster [Verrucomicrobiae bacterium]|jgi:glycolate oxidase iron-sulfur subunit
MSAPFLDEKKALACIHCGLCLSSCPTYLETGNENDSPRGRIYLMRAVQDGRLPLESAVVRHFDLCLGCRACETACPSGVAYGNLLEHTRDHVEKNYLRPPAQRWLRRVLIEKIFPHPARLKWLLAPARLANAAGLSNILPRFFRESLALAPADARAATLPEWSRATAPRRGCVGFIEGCVMSAMFGPTNLNTVRLLNAAGYDVFTPRAQGCCGALFAHGGNLEAARACARVNIAAFAGQDCQAIITNAAGCGSSLKEYGHWLSSPEAAAFGGKIKDIAEFLAADGGEIASRPNGERVTFHDACHLAHAQGITKAPRELLRAAGVNLIDMPEADVCCGSAGTYNLTEPDMAKRLQRRKIENILRTGADVAVTSNPGCILQIRAGLAEAGSNIRVMHIVDYLCAVIQPPPTTKSPS